MLFRSAAFTVVTSFLGEDTVESIRNGLHIFASYAFALFILIFVFVILIIAVAIIAVLLKKLIKR